MERLLKYLESHFRPADIRWSGHVHHLTKIEPGRAECALAIMYMIFERWLPVIELVAFLIRNDHLLTGPTKPISLSSATQKVSQYFYGH